MLHHTTTNSHKLTAVANIMLRKFVAMPTVSSSFASSVPTMVQPRHGPGGRIFELKLFITEELAKYVESYYILYNATR